MIKKQLNVIVASLLLVILTLSCTSQPDVYMFSYFKGKSQDGLHLAYSHDGLKWQALNNDQSILEPRVAADKLMRDPCIIRGRNGVFHMVWTVSWNDKGIGYASSADLIHWSEQQFIPVMQSVDSVRNCWAPEIFYDVEQDEYMIYWASTIAGQFTSTTSTLENKYNHRMYFVKTKDFNSFSTPSLLYDEGFNVIDATIHKENGAYVMFLKDETREPVEKNIRIARSKSLTSDYGAASKPITGDFWAEGPTAIKIGSSWVVYFDKYREHTMGAVRSEDLKTWTDISGDIDFPSGTRHGTVFEISNDEFLVLKNKYPSK